MQFPNILAATALALLPTITNAMALPSAGEVDSAAALVPRGDSCSNYHPYTVGQISLYNGAVIVASLQFSYDGDNWYGLPGTAYSGQTQTYNRNGALSGITRGQQFQLRISDALGGTSAAGAWFNIPPAGQEEWVANLAANTVDIIEWEASCNAGADLGIADTP